MLSWSLIMTYVSMPLGEFGGEELELKNSREIHAINPPAPALSCMKQ
jgi:hypothetical protein